MSPAEVSIQGTLKPDGTLELDQKPSLSPGRVQVTLKPLPSRSPSRPGLAEILQQIQQAQTARGHHPRTKEAIDAELQATRDDAEAEMQAMEQFHATCRQAREPEQENPE